MSSTPPEAGTSEKPAPESFRIRVVSFGFKHGPPSETDLLFDVRFLPNPFYVTELKPGTGLEQQVASYVLDNDAGREFMLLLEPLLVFLIPQYRGNGKALVTVGIGCTGGKHRSVAVAEAIKRILTPLDAAINVTHRDIDKE